MYNQLGIFQIPNGGGCGHVCPDLERKSKEIGVITDNAERVWIQKIWKTCTERPKMEVAVSSQGDILPQVFTILGSLQSKQVPQNGVSQIGEGIRNYRKWSVWLTITKLCLWVSCFIVPFIVILLTHQSWFIMETTWEITWITIKKPHALWRVTMIFV